MMTAFQTLAFLVSAGLATRILYLNAMEMDKPAQVILTVLQTLVFLAFVQLAIAL